MFSKYLYSKVKSSNMKFIYLILDSEEINFLKKYNIPFYKDGDGYCVDSEKLKSQFCH